MVRANKGRHATRPQQAWAVVTCGALLTIGTLGAQREAARTFQNGNTRQEKTAKVSQGAVIPVTPVAWYAQVLPDGAQRTPSVKIDVDAAHAPAADVNAPGSSASEQRRELKNALAGVVALPDALTVGNEKQAAPTDEDAGIPAWFAWGHLNGASVPVQVAAPTNLPAEALGAYAVRDESGVTVCLVNKTPSRLLTNARVCLRRGVYRIERLTISKDAKDAVEDKDSRGTETGRHGDKGEEPSETLRPKSEAVLSSGLSSVEHLERLQGCDIGSAATIGKGVCLEPGEVCLYRYTDVARAARASWFDVFAQLRDMSREHSGPARRLAAMLHEADGYVAGVRGGGGLENRLGCVHHLLLVTAQAHSLHHNYQMRHTVNEANGKALMGVLDRLTDALSETSAALLGLVPQVAVTLPPAPASNEPDRAKSAARTEATPAFLVVRQKAGNKEEKAAGVENNRGNTARTVTIALANTGSRSISSVKIGLNANILPAAVTCDPADPAYFDALHPGQTVRATFHVRGAGAENLPNALLTGDVSYFAGTAPAHLRPHAW